MTLAAGSPRPPQSVDDLIRRWGAAELTRTDRNPRPAPATVLRRVEVLAAVHARYNDAGLFTCDPTTVALHYYGMRANCTRKTRTSRILAATLEDFRAWCTRTTNRGD